MYFLSLKTKIGTTSPPEDSTYNEQDYKPKKKTPDEELLPIQKKGQLHLNNFRKPGTIILIKS